jgi:hypothetical protein
VRGLNSLIRRCGDIRLTLRICDTKQMTPRTRTKSPNGMERDLAASKLPWGPQAR